MAKAVLGLGLMVVAAALLPFAAGEGIGASGQCYNADGSDGGSATVRVDTDDEGLVTVPRVANLDGQGGGAVEAASMFARGSVEDGGQTGSACDNPDDAGRNDYVSVQTDIGGTEREVCYAGSPRTTGECPEYGTGYRDADGVRHDAPPGPGI